MMMSISSMILIIATKLLRQLTELNYSSYERGRLQEQYFFWLPVTTMASDSLINIFRQSAPLLRPLVTKTSNSSSWSIVQGVYIHACYHICFGCWPLK